MLPQTFPVALAAFALLSTATAQEGTAKDGKAQGTQEGKFVAYPQRDILSPFRSPSDVYAPPDEAFRQLRIMQRIADRPGVAKDFDAGGREIVDDDIWREARAALAKERLDAGYLAQIMRFSRNAADRATAFYAAFFVADVDHVFNLIGHIPGEPERKTREAAMPRAIAFLRANVSQRFGDLSADVKDRIAKSMPEPGSPAARSRGIVRAPRDDDYLHQVPLVPFFQLLDLDEAIDQAQGLWFLKETFIARQDLALTSLEPALPRVAQLLRSKAPQVRTEAIGLVQAIAPKDMQQPPPADDVDELVVWAKEAAKTMFPPIRNLNNALVQLLPSTERDAIAAAGEAALKTSSIGDPVTGHRKDGSLYRGFRVARVPDEMKVLGIPAEAIVTTVNGTAVSDAATLLQALRTQLGGKGTPKKLFVEYLFGDEQHAVEYRVL